MLPRNAEEDHHGPHNHILPQSGVPRQRTKRPRDIGIHSCKDKRFLCTECHKTCSATKGTAF